MKISFKSIMSLALVVLFLLSMLISCADNKNDGNSDDSTNGTPTTTAPTSNGDATDGTTDPDVTTLVTPDNLPEANFQNYQFRVMSRGTYSQTWYSRDIYSESISGDLIGDAVYERNAKIEDQYGFKVVEIAVKDSDMVNTLKNSVLGGTKDYDMICGKLKDNITNAIVSGYLTDLNTIDLMNLSKPYYDQNSVNDLSISGKLYAVTGDLLTMDNDATRCVLFNKYLFNTNVLADTIGSDLYTAVKDGKWTYEMMNVCAVAATKDLDGNGEMTIDDCWGIATEQFNALAFMNAAGKMLFVKDDTDVPKFVALDESYYDVYAAECALLAGDGARLYSNGYTEAIPQFQEGLVLFYPAQLADVPLMRSMEFEFGIVPLPKYNEAQEKYYSPITAYGSNCISVPAYADDLDRTAIILESLSCESMYKVTPAYYEISLKGKHFNDPESGEMLDIIFETTVFELGYMWNWGDVYGSLTGAFKSGNTNLASAFKAVEKVASRTVQITVDAVNKLQ